MANKTINVEIASEEEGDDGWTAEVTRYTTNGFTEIRIDVQVTDGEYDAIRHQLFTAANAALEVLPGL